MASRLGEMAGDRGAFEPLLGYTSKGVGNAMK
jgi:hypothetical protein